LQCVDFAEGLNEIVVRLREIDTPLDQPASERDYFSKS
jgi:hypothetical protein